MELDYVSAWLRLPYKVQLNHICWDHDTDRAMVMEWCRTNLGDVFVDWMVKVIFMHDVETPVIAVANAEHAALLALTWS